MFTKCYIVKINSSLESMYEDLAEAGFDYATKLMTDGDYMEVSFEVWSVREIQEIMEIMKWYV